MYRTECEGGVMGDKILDAVGSWFLLAVLALAVITLPFLVLAKVNQRTPEKEWGSYEVVCNYPAGGYLRIPEEAVEYASISNGTTKVGLHSGGEVETTLPCTIGKKPAQEPS
jgi:hypothetical protein